MTIKTTYNTGQTVYVIHENKLREGKVRQIQATLRENQGEPAVQYTLLMSVPGSYSELESGVFKQEDVYPTREKAKQSI